MLSVHTSEAFTSPFIVYTHDIGVCGHSSVATPANGQCGHSGVAVIATELYYCSHA